LGAIKSDVISQIAISKSICGNLNNLNHDCEDMFGNRDKTIEKYLLKNRGILMLDAPRPAEPAPELLPKLCCRGAEMCGFMAAAGITTRK
jgi:hypothetical protein